MIFETKRLYTRQWDKADLKSAIKLWSDPRVMQFIDVRERLTDEDIEKKLMDQIQLDKEFKVQYWALVLKEKNQIIGCCGLRPYVAGKHIYELGFHLIPEFWGNGYATEAALGTIDYAFKKLHVQKLFAGHHPENIASKYLLKKLGFQYVKNELYQPTGLMHLSYILENPQFSSEKIRQVKLLPYDKNWVTQFEEERRAVEKILGANCIQIHHIGSTSIPEIDAKPIIDILPVVSNLSQVDQHNRAFEHLGYECMGEYGIPGRRFYWKSKEKRSHHIHLFEAGNSEIERHLAFRDYLHQNSEVARAYSQIKRDLAVEFATDIVSYVEGKSSFVRYIDYMTGHAQSDQLSATDEIVLQSYDLSWQKLANAEMSSIKHIINLPFSKIEHLGSTAIEGMIASPIIDIFISVSSIEEAGAWIKPLENLGYVFWSDNPDKSHLRFFKGMPPFGTRRTHHVHIMEAGRDFENYVKFHDILNKSPADRQAYIKLKQDLAKKYTNDRERYTEDKAKFIRRILNQISY